ncbi:MAG TPA: NAD+ synthase [Nitrososphaerales archaeon]|nr:NAD+ synthase [Nitrososphaerales archaeon]
MSKSRKHAFNAQKEITRISSFIKSQIDDSHAKGVVVGISGGIDSAVIAALCRKALGSSKVLGVFLFEERSHKSQDFSDARLLAKNLRIKSLDLCITPVVDSFLKLLKSNDCRVSRLTLANIKARTRMVLLYAIANQRNLLVAGTGDRSENLLGYFTKYGDGGVDFLPIGHLYKTEVRALGTSLRIPYNIVTKPSSPNLWPGHKATHELPADYDLLDRILTLIFDSNEGPKEIREKIGAPEDLVRRVIKLNTDSKHKRQTPASIL